jgi:hypothetical protein
MANYRMRNVPSSIEFERKTHRQPDNRDQLGFSFSANQLAYHFLVSF